MIVDNPLGALVLVASDATEYTTTTAATLVTLTVSIPVDCGALITFNTRKTSGAAVAPVFQLLANGAAVDSGAVILGTTNEAQNGQVIVVLGRRDTNYVRAFTRIVTGAGAAQAVQPVQSAGAGSTGLPIATITSFGFVTDPTNAAVTVGFKNINIYRLQGVF